MCPKEEADHFLRSLPMESHCVYNESEQDKIGWVHGFYDCTFDAAGLHSGGTRTGLLNGVADLNEYIRGYRAGTTTRLASQVRLWCTQNPKPQLEERETTPCAARISLNHEPMIAR
ncbi:MAG: hypothetical protein LAP85_04780 [Acidobacteriia bacterium]|nr:hypothetical protein [Terriglobia bacterium]